MASICSGLSRFAKSPPCTAGCSVLTRPPIISGKPVSSLTSSTFNPASLRILRVPPVEISSMPNSTSARAKSATPDLSETEISAREARRKFSLIVLLYALHSFDRNDCHHGSLTTVILAPPHPFVAARHSRLLPDSLAAPIGRARHLAHVRRGRAA